jgi:peptidyl-prolyl cis-trans isomerase A (cyclophilin A)
VALAAGISALQLDALYGLPPGTVVNFVTLQGWAPLPGGAVIEGLELPTPVYAVETVRQVIRDAPLADPTRIHQYAKGALLSALQVDVLFGLPPGTVASFLAAQGWEALPGGAVVTGLALPVDGVTATGLSFSRTARFTLTGNSLGVTPISVGVTRCSGLALVPGGTTTQREFTCRVAGTGTITFEVKTPEGAPLLSRSFQVPEPQVTVQTSLGTFVLELNPTAVPATVANFLAYVNDGFYAGTIFHRVVAPPSSFSIVQAGGFASGLAYRQPTYAPIALESNRGLSNLRGTIGMARSSSPNSATSQFFVNVSDNVVFDYASAQSPGYAVFGRVVSGLEVIDAIGALPTATVTTALGSFQNVPVTEVVITQAQQTR